MYTHIYIYIYIYINVDIYIYGNIYGNIICIYADACISMILHISISSDIIHVTPVIIHAIAVKK